VRGKDGVRRAFAEPAILELAALGGDGQSVAFLIDYAACPIRPRGKVVLSGWGLSVLAACEAGADAALRALLERNVRPGPVALERANAAAGGAGHLGCLKALADYSLLRPFALLAAARGGHIDAVRCVLGRGLSGVGLVHPLAPCGKIVPNCERVCRTLRGALDGGYPVIEACHGGHFNCARS
jgi:hypothetical protein